MKQKKSRRSAARSARTAMKQCFWGSDCQTQHYLPYFLQCFYALRGRNHCKWRCFWAGRGRKHRYLWGFFFQFRAKLSSLGNVQKHCKNQHFCPAKTAKNIPQRASKSQKLLPRPPDKTQRKKNTFQKRKKSTTKSEKTQVFFTFVLPVPGGRVHEHVHFVL